MAAQEVILIFDIGKTNKKLLVYDRQYTVRKEFSVRLNEQPDADGFLSESISALDGFIRESLGQLYMDPSIDIKAINISAYGASMVLLENDKPMQETVYNYLKEYPAALAEQLYRAHGGEEEFSVATASPLLGSLNAGLQLYRYKQESPQFFEQCRVALHLPQYLAWLIHGRTVSEVTSIGCHTALWNFQQWDYHDWVKEERLNLLMAPLQNADEPFEINREGNKIVVGTGLHDSSAALIPYLRQFHEPFALLSTGTWCITLNPFNEISLTPDELAQDVLCYISYQGQQVKASRLHGGAWHAAMVNRVATHFGCTGEWLEQLDFDPELLNDLTEEADITDFPSAASAYHFYMQQFVKKQAHAVRLVTLHTAVKQLFIDGGFSHNKIFLRLLQMSLPELSLFVAEVAQGSALGAALVLHDSWNQEPYPENIVTIQSIDRLHI